MSEVIVDTESLMEPNLWVPFKQPVNFARLDPSWKYYKDLFYVYVPGATGNIDQVSGIMGTTTGIISPVATPYGIGAIGDTSSYITSNVGNPAGEPYSSILCVVHSLNYASALLFATRRNNSNPTYYCGVSWNVSSTLQMAYGDNTGATNSDLRRLTSTSNVTTNTITSMCGCFKSETTGALFVNGRFVPLSPGGTGGAVAGTGNLTIHNRWSFNALGWVPILLLAFFNTQLPDQVMQSLSADPYQMFKSL